MRNKFAGPCYRCGETVEPGQGHFERIPLKQRKPGDPKWRTQHAECAIKHRGTDVQHTPCSDVYLAEKRQHVERAIEEFQARDRTSISTTYIYWYFAERGGMHKADSHVSKFDETQCIDFIQMLSEIEPSNIRTWRKKRARQGWDARLDPNSPEMCA